MYIYINIYMTYSFRGLQHLFTTIFNGAMQSFIKLSSCHSHYHSSELYLATCPSRTTNLLWNNIYIYHSTTLGYTTLLLQLFNIATWSLFKSRLNVVLYSLPWCFRTITKFDTLLPSMVTSPLHIFLYPHFT